MADPDEPRTPDAIVDHARLTAQAKGKPLLKEQIEALDQVIAWRCSSARANMVAYPLASVDWDGWGRFTYVLESLLSFLERLDSDPVARDYLIRRFRREVIRHAEGERDEKIPVDNSGDRPSA